MKQIAIVARRPFYWRGRSVQAGERLELSAVEAAILQRRGDANLAAAAPAPAPKLPRPEKVYRAAALEAETETPAAEPRRRHKRRDLEAEE